MIVSAPVSAGHVLDVRPDVGRGPGPRPEGVAVVGDVVDPHVDRGRPRGVRCDVGFSPTDHHVRPCAAVEHVVAVVAPQRVVAVAAAEGVLSRAGGEGVCPETAIQNIVGQRGERCAHGRAVVEIVGGNDEPRYRGRAIGTIPDHGATAGPVRVGHRPDPGVADDERGGVGLRHGDYVGLAQGRRVIDRGAGPGDRAGEGPRGHRHPRDEDNDGNEDQRTGRTREDRHAGSGKYVRRPLDLI